MKPWILVGVSEALLGVAVQSQMIPDSMVSIFAQLPLVAVIIWLQLQNQKWLKSMLDTQREALHAIYEANTKSLNDAHESRNKFLNTLLGQIETQQNKMSYQLDELTKQVALFGATLSEVGKVDDVIDRLLAEIRK